jgi:hypothetical protein
MNLEAMFAASLSRYRNPVGGIMPLTRGSIIGYDAGRMIFKFTMLRPDGRVVDCGISGAAMDDLVGDKGGSPEERALQFVELRDRIEQIASDMFDRNSTHQVRIFSKHVDLKLRGKT